MNKINAVIKKEYLSIVKTKTFIILTLLMPVIMLLVFSMPFLMTNLSTGTTNIAINDASGMFNEHNLKGGRGVNISFISGDIEILKDNFMHNFDALLYIPNFDIQYPGGIRLYAEKQMGLTRIRTLETQIEKVIEDIRFVNAGIDRELIERLRVSLSIESIVLTEAGEKSGDSTLAFLIGYIVGFMMYVILFFYGNMIMNSIMDEKKNRIVEILVSSLRPFELMFGKIIGIAGVALTQLLIWGILGTIIFAFFTVGVLPHTQVNNIDTEFPAELESGFATEIMNFLAEPGAINFSSIFFIFLIYTVLGYLFYSTMFAAVGSLCDDDKQSQNFTLPITIPIILSLFIMMNVADNPHSPLAIWSSLIPFSSPIVMVARVPFGVPIWQLVLSIGLLVISFGCSTWIAGKIYRTAILLYGKKFKWKDLWKFVRA
jgi:ABC-2 type transport system permease protein